MLGTVWPLISFCSSDLNSLMWYPQPQAQLHCRTRQKWPRESFSLGWVLCRVMLRSAWEAAWCLVRDLSWEPANPAKPLCSSPLSNLGWTPRFSWLNPKERIPSLLLAQDCSGMVSDSAWVKISFLYCDLLDWGSWHLISSYLLLIMGPQGLTSYSWPLAWWVHGTICFILPSCTDFSGLGH